MALKVCGWAVDHQPVQAAASPAPRPLTDGCPEPPLEKPRMSLDRTSCPMAPARLPVMGGDWKQPPPLSLFHLRIGGKHRRAVRPWICKLHVILSKLRGKLTCPRE